MKQYLLNSCGKCFSLNSIKMTSNQVILGIKAGRGFGFLNKSFLIEANLNGHSIKTDLIQPSHNIIIGAELLWQAEKKVLKRLRIGNVPLKVECFPVVNGKKEERVGFILLTLRAAKTIAPNCMLTDASGIWHNFLGLKTNVKSYNPSLLLNLHIEDMSSMECRKENMFSNAPLSKYIPLICPKEGIIFSEPHQQLTNNFLITISLESAGYLNMLVESPNDSDGNFTLSCDIMGCTKQERNISVISSLTVDIDCKFALKVSGSLESLRNYFQQKELAFITLISNGNDIAYCLVNGSCLISEEVLQTFYIEDSFKNVLSRRSRCHFSKISTHEIPVSVIGSRPYLDTSITLQYLCDDNKKVEEQGETESCTVVLSPYESRNIYPDVNGKSWNFKNINISNVHNLLQTVHHNIQEWFTLNFTVESILVHNVSYGDRFYFRFHQANSIVVLKHTHAVAVNQVNRFVPVDGVSCSLYFRGFLKNVQNEFSTCKPRIELMAIVNGEGIAIAASEVDSALLFEGKGNCFSVVGLKSNSQDVEYGIIKLRMALEEVMVMDNGNYEESPFSESYKISSLDSHSCRIFTKVIEDQESDKRESFVEESPPTQSTVEVELQMKLQELREASRRMEDDFKLEISRLQVEKKHLFDQIALQEEENAQLLKVKQDKEHELEKLKRNSLTEDQIAGILKDLKLAEEKYEIAHRSKIFFKEQWARAMREVHIIKSGHRQEMTLQIKYNKEELKNLGRMLPPAEGPRRPRAHPRSAPPPPPPPSAESGPEGDAPLALRPKRETSDDLQKSSLEFKLQELVQQRDSLLNTGTYALDHHLINMLNKQIRQLLAESTHKFE